MTLKKINPEDLKKGQKYFVELEYRSTFSDKTYKFIDSAREAMVIEKEEPIYTHESSTDTELEMLVNVASRLLVAYGASQGTMPPDDRVVKDALDLITACKNALKEGER